MKKAKVTLVALATLMLAGCGKPTQTTAVPTATTQQTTNTTTSKPTDKETTAKQTTAKETTAAPTTAVNPEDDEAKKWGNTVATLMKGHLNGHVIPYLKIAAKATTLEATFNSSKGRIEIVGDLIASGDTVISGAKTIYDAFGWDTSKATATNFQATLDSEHLTVTLQEGTTSATEGFYFLTAQYDEPYDPTTSSDWPADVKTAFTTYLHGHELPFVYLGTVAPTATGPTSSYSSETMNIIGGNWNDDIVTKANAAFGADTTTTWDMTGSTTTSFKAVGTMADKCELTIKIAADFNNKAKLSVTVKEGFNPPASGDWSQDVKDAFVTSLGGYALPYVYLASLNPEISTSTANKLVLAGGTWDDQIITLAETAFTADNADGIDWTITKGNESITADKVLSTGDTLNVVIENYEDPYYYYYGTDPEYTLLTATYKQGYSVPTDPAETAWSADVQTAMQTYLAGTVLPWFYLNLPAVDVGTKYYPSLKELDLKGGDWNDKVVDEMTRVLTADKDNGRDWTFRTDASGSKPYYYAESDDASGNHFKLKMYKDYNDKILVEIYFTEGFNIPDAAHSVWSQDIQNDFNTNLGKVFPYVYLGASAPTGSWSSSYNYYTITGGKWNDQIVTLFNTAFSGWEISTGVESSRAAYYAVLKSTTDNSFDKVMVSSDSSGNAIYRAWHYAAVTIPEGGAWASDVETEMKNRLGGEVMPYVYLGTTSNTFSWNSTYSYLQVNGGKWAPQYTDAAIASLEAANNADTDVTNDWKITTSVGSYGTDVTATRTRADGGTYKLVIKATYSASEMDCYYVPAYVYPTEASEKSWSDDLKTAFSNTLGGVDVPWFYMAASKADVTYSASTTSTIPYVTVSGGLWHEEIMQEAITSFKADGWSFLMDYTTTTPQALFTKSVTKSLEDGTSETHYYTARVSNDYYGKASLKVYYK